MQVTDKMVNSFEQRTREHIKRVQDNIKKVIQECKFPLDAEELLRRSKLHDLSKFEKDEYWPYVWLTEHFKRKGKIELTESLKDFMLTGMAHHHGQNRHHPNFFDEVGQMTNIDIIEMVCDWAAMTQENKTSLKKWANKHVGIKWKFSIIQTKFIYDLINILE